MLLWYARGWREREAILDLPKYVVSLTTNSQETTRRFFSMNKIKKDCNTDAVLNSFLNESGDVQGQLSALPYSYERETELELKLGIVYRKKELI